jgi:hypothetical protein
MSVQITSYHQGDENQIVALFEEVFQTQRSLAHWSWKYRDDPYGSHRISLAWLNRKLVAHYGGYPLPFHLGNCEDLGTALVYHAGDKMTSPAVRGMGFGKTSILVKTCEHFKTCHCRGKIAFYYGVVTGHSERMGKLFLDYRPVAPVVHWIRDVDGRYRPGTWSRIWGPWRVKAVRRLPDDIDGFLKKVGQAYGTLVWRTSSYLQWRYLERPDLHYYFLVLRHKRKLEAWAVFRRQGQDLLWGDALISPGLNEQGLSFLLSNAVRIAGGHENISRIVAWFPDRNFWLTALLKNTGFRPEPEPNGLIFVIIPIDQKSPDVNRQNFHYSWGDTDLF